MAIKFSCPNCKRALSVKDQLAGKKAACPACKKVLVIPNPKSTMVAPAHVDLDAMAMQALADEPAAAPAADTRTIDFTCPMCDEPVKVAYDLAGKQTPCPSCRRIVKVPMPAKTDPKDWRTAPPRLPSMAKRETAPAPEGAWGSTTSTGVVSRDALLQTGAVVEEEDPDAGRQLLMRVTLGGIAVVSLVLITLFVRGFFARGKAEKLIAQALEAVNGDSSKLSPEQAAVVHRAAGEYHLRTGTPDAAQKASEQFQLARSALSRATADERDVMLAELAVSQIDLGGDKADADNGKALEWGKALEGVRQTLDQIRAPEARLEAARQVARKLASKGQARAAQSLAGRLGAAALNKPGETANANGELVGVVALELLRSGNQKEAQSLAELTLPSSAAKGAESKTSPPIVPSLVALAIAFDRPEPIARKTGKPDEENSNSEDLNNLLLGRAEGLAYKGDLVHARELLTTARPVVRLKGLIALAALAREATPADTTDLVAALDLVEGEAKNQGVSPWLLLRLAQLAVESGMRDRALQAAGQIADASLKAQAHLAVLRERLQGTKDKADGALADEVPEKTGAHARAWQILARLNARLDSGTVKALEGLEESRRAPALAGAALGIQDRKR
jgi:hypothetical protein